MAGQLKRENPDIQEDLVLIRALRDSNLPKFLTDDATLFKVTPLLFSPSTGLIRYTSFAGYSFRLVPWSSATRT